jgi:hypothetical protein
MAEDKIEFAKLPSVSDLPATKRKLAMELMEALDQIVEKKAAILVTEDHLKDELEKIQRLCGTTGLRHGALAFCSQPVKGKKTLDKMLLLENGCPADVLNASYKTGQPSVRNTFKRLEEEEE